jgi:hypothetical protein
MPPLLERFLRHRRLVQRIMRATSQMAIIESRSLTILSMSASETLNAKRPSPEQRAVVNQSVLHKKMTAA